MSVLVSFDDMFACDVLWGGIPPATAVSAVKAMVNAPDFARDMLLLAVQVSHESGTQSVLLRVLEQLLGTLRRSTCSRGASGESVVEAMTLLRCIIRLGHKLLMDPVSNKCDRSVYLPGVR
jgi:hypothetical protein